MSEQSGIRKKLKEKWKEAAQAVFPIIGIVLLLCFTIAPISPSVLLCFLMGAVLILVGMMFFTLGAEMSMTPMGERIGTCLTRSRNLPVIVAVLFTLLHALIQSYVLTMLTALFYGEMSEPKARQIKAAGKHPEPAENIAISK